MTITSRTAPTSGIPMAPLRRTTFVAGALSLASFASSIPARFYFLDPVLSDPEYVLGPGGDTRVVVGSVLDVLKALACAGAADSAAVPTPRASAVAGVRS